MGTGDKIVGYCRVSTVEQGSNGVGLDAQREAIEAEAERRGWQLVRIEEDRLSGKSLKRPGLTRALRACETGEVSGIVVAKLDRLSRSLIDFASVLEKARARGYNVVALDLGVDLSTPAGELVANVMASVAQWERRAIGQRTREALAVKREQGVVLGRRPEIPADVVERMRGMRAGGAGWTAIADLLNAEGVPTAHEGAQWWPATVRAALLAVGRT